MNLAQLILALVSLAIISPLASGQDLVTQEAPRVLLRLSPNESGRQTVINDIDFSPDGESIAIGASNGNVGTVQILPIARDGVPQLVFQSDDSIHEVVFSPDGKMVASAGMVRATVAVIGEKGKSKVIGKPTQLKGSSRVAFSPDSKLLAVGNRNGSSTVVALTTNEIQFEMDQYAGVGPADSGLLDVQTTHMNFSPDGKLLAVTTDFGDEELPGFENIQVWDVTTGKLRFFLRGGVGEFSPDGHTLAYRHLNYGSARIVFLDLDTFLLVRGPGGGEFSFANFAPDGDTIAAVRNQQVDVFSITPTPDQPYKRKRVTVLKHDTELKRFEFSPDGQSIVTGDTQGTIRLWRLPLARD